MTDDQTLGTLQETWGHSLVPNLAAIMGRVEAMHKDGDNKGMNFRYVSITQMLEKLRPEMAAAGIIMYPEVIDSTFEEMTTRGGATMTCCYLTVRWTVTGGSESLFLTTVGEAHDTGDKSANKALTAAHKRALMTLFMISADEDTDGETPEERTSQQARHNVRLPGSYGTCARHGVEYFQKGKMRSPAHQKDDGGWCNQPRGAVSPEQGAAADAAFGDLPSESSDMDRFVGWVGKMGKSQLDVEAALRKEADWTGLISQWITDNDKSYDDLTALCKGAWGQGRFEVEL
jgi:hypothetical protein